MRAIAIVVAAGLAAAGPWSAPARADSAGADVAGADRIEQARARALTDAYQRVLPRYERDDGGGGGAAARGRPAVERSREGSIDTRAQRREDPGALGALMRTLLWVLLAAAVVLVVLWIVRDLMPGRAAAELPPDEARPAGARDVAAVLERPLGDADELARRGELAAAIHALLLRTLEALARTAAICVERADTSREILARVPLPADARAALAGLITAVELTHFGGAPATAEDYDRCRREFHRFAAVFRAGGAAGAGEPRAVPA